MLTIRKIVKKLIPTNLFSAIEPYGHLIESVIANIRYGFPSRNMHVIGVTGTNGKTTTTLLIQKMLSEAGYKVGVLSTVAYGIGDDIKPQIEHITTAQAGILQRRLRDFKKAGVEWVVLESSSHSLAQYRTWGVPYEIAVMTNVTYEHLDYHKTFERYLEAKRRLFRLAAKHGRKFGVVNAEDPGAQKFVDTTPRSVTYGIKKGDIRASKIKLAGDHSTYTATFGKDSYTIRINIPGDFNISNSLAAVAVGREVGLTKRQIEKGIAALRGVEGRMTVLSEGQIFKVLVDYAGTPDAFDKFFATIRPATKGKLIVVYGSPAQRDYEKRPIQGRISGEQADIVVLTEEDDRDEQGEKIMGEIAAGALAAGMKLDKNLFKIGNREEAIGFALAQAKSKDDLVAILGKGHEKTIERADGIHPWSDIEVTKAALQELVKKQHQKKK
jgi:UDP-N-acetylmuramoyl-L-alanyl-D-glutamate--2,6-diaminopimelate ligase